MKAHRAKAQKAQKAQAQPVFGEPYGEMRDEPKNPDSKWKALFVSGVSGSGSGAGCMDFARFLYLVHSDTWPRRAFGHSESSFQSIPFLSFLSFVPQLACFGSRFPFRRMQPEDSN